MAVGIQNQFAAREGADQNKQRGFGQMKISEQLVDHAEFMPGLDENVGLGAAGFNHEIATLIIRRSVGRRGKRRMLPRQRFCGRIFQCAHDCGSHRENRPGIASRVTDRIRCVFRNFVAFRMDAVIFYFFRMNRLKSAQANID